MIGTPSPHYYQMMLQSLDCYVQLWEDVWDAVMVNAGIGYGTQEYSIGTFDTQEAATQAAESHLADLRKYYLDQWEYVKAFPSLNDVCSTMTNKVND